MLWNAIFDLLMNIVNNINPLGNIIPPGTCKQSTYFVNFEHDSLPIGLECAKASVAEPA
jgi:hypothetical protein